jgi:plasmid maintenance system antidote protein VapI
MSQTKDQELIDIIADKFVLALSYLNALNGKKIKRIEIAEVMETYPHIIKQIIDKKRSITIRQLYLFCHHYKIDPAFLFNLTDTIQIIYQINKPINNEFQHYRHSSRNQSSSRIRDIQSTGIHNSNRGGLSSIRNTQTDEQKP